MEGTDLRRKEEAAIRALLADALADAHPRNGVREFVGQRRLRPRPLRVRLAFGLLAVALLCVLRTPLCVRAVASSPIVGGVFRRFVEVSAPDLAYQAGFLQELDRTYVTGGIRLTVVGARSESGGTTVFYTLSPEPGEESEVWGRIRDRRLLVDQILLTLEDQNSTPDPASYWFFSRVEDTIYGMVRGAPLGTLENLFGGNITLLVEAREASPLAGDPFAPMALGQAAVAWKVQVPTQSIVTGEQRVAVARSVPGISDRITVTEVAFSPLQIVLHYEVSPGGSSAADRETVESAPWTLLGECFALVTGDGTEMPCFGYSNPNEHMDGSTGHGEVYFVPTSQRDLSVVFRPLRPDPTPPTTSVQSEEWLLRGVPVSAVAGVKKENGSVRLALGSGSAGEVREFIASPSYILDPTGISLFELRR